jgi:MoaA/NifB/PqqE/SkfB family radical SAM enzyme
LLERRENINSKSFDEKKAYNEYEKLLIELAKSEGATCSTCSDKDKCKFAFDDYNTNGDCLAVK